VFSIHITVCKLTYVLIFHVLPMYTDRKQSSGLGVDKVTNPQQGWRQLF